MSLSCPVDLDVLMLRREVTAMYASVAAAPDGAFHFHRGPEYAVRTLGYDAHELDPLGGLRMTTDGFKTLSALLADAGRRLCGGRIAAVTEGGYHLGALGEGIRATIGALRGTGV